MHEYYASQSAVSAPNKYAYLFEKLPHDPASISRVAQGLVYHYIGGQYVFGYCPPQERMGEIDMRYMERMLARLVEMDNRPLTEPRAFENRFVGCCRDFSLISCAILRQHGIPARLRYGFANYFIPGYWMDHVIVEMWNGTRWQRFDPQMPADQMDFNVLDIPSSFFVTGGRAWQLQRSELADPARFGLGPDMPELSGAQFIVGRLWLDVAALNKQEMLCWDSWGSAEWGRTLSTDEEHFVDLVAKLSLEPDVTPLRDLYKKDDRLRVPEFVTCSSPARGPQTVKVG